MDLRVPLVAMNSLDFFDRLVERDAGMLRKPCQRTPAAGEDDPFGHAANTANPTLVLDPFQPERLSETRPAPVLLPQHFRTRLRPYFVH